MIKVGTFALLLTLLSPAFALAEEILIPNIILTDKPSRRSFTISQVVRNGAKMPDDIRVHMREITSNRAIDLSKQMTFNKLESSFDLTYFYVHVATDWYVVVPPDEDAATYPELIRSIKFFDEAFNNKIPGDDENGFSPKVPFIINKATGQMRNLESSVKHKAEIPTFTIVDTSLLPAGPIVVQEKPGYRLVSVPLADGTVQHYSSHPIPGLILCEEILRKPSKYQRSP